MSHGLAIEPWLSLVARGLIPGHTAILMAGENLDVDTGSPEDLWPAPPGTELYPFQSASVSLEVVSTSPNDTAEGTGAQRVVINGLNGSFVPAASSTVVLNGTTPVAVPTQYRRIFPPFVGTPVGTGLTNAGDITIRVAGGGAILGFIPTGKTIAPQLIYTVPIGCIALLHQVGLGIHQNQADSAKSWICFRDAINGGPWFKLPASSVSSTGASYITQGNYIPPILGPGYDLRLELAATTPSLNISGNWSLVQVQL